MSEPGLGDEKEALVSSLETQRHHVLGILEGLSDEDLRRPALARLEQVSRRGDGRAG